MEPCSVSAQTRLLAVAPHPDDETLGCGLLIQHVLAAGGAVKLLLLTDGDNNPWPQRYVERCLRIDAAARQRWGRRRRNEAMRAVAQLGLPASALHPLGWLDMDLTRRLCEDAAGSIGTVRDIAREFQPNLVCCPALSDSHPDHGAAHVLCRLALADAVPVAPTVLAYPVHGATDVARYPIRIDATPGQRRRKLLAMAEHETQMAMSRRRMRRLAARPESYALTDAVPGAPDLPWQPPAMLHRWLRLLVATPSGVRDWRWPDAPLVRGADGRYQLRWPAGAPAPVAGFVKLHLDWPSPWIFDHWGWHAF